jgi:16S rRNA (adenine1518-N6/adenine1519-N6)-dimethyltransferase
VEIIEGDALTFRPEDHNLTPHNYTIIANLPYYITSHFIRTMFERWPQPRALVLMVQKEVAQRIVPQPFKLNLLALSVQFYATAEILFSVSRGNFHPAPTVDSAVIKLIPHATPLTDDATKDFFRMLRIAFVGKRKQLINSLSNYLHLPKNEVAEKIKDAGIDPTLRPERLALEQWLSLYQVLNRDSSQLSA